jgi:putative addiction module killer protein
MSSHTYEIQIYAAENGKKPFSVWLSDLDSKTSAIVDGRIQRVKHGLFGDCKSLGSGVFELRIKFGPGIRVYFGVEKNKIVLLLCGGDKSTQKKDIAKAKEYWKDWEE